MLKKKLTPTHYEVVDIEDEDYYDDTYGWSTVRCYTIAEIAEDGTYLGSWQEYNLI